MKQLCYFIFCGNCEKLHLINKWIKKKNVNTFIQQGCIKVAKSDNEDIYNVIKTIIFQINNVVLNFLFVKESLGGGGIMMYIKKKSCNKNHY